MRKLMILAAGAAFMLATVTSCGSSSTETATTNVVDTVKVDSTVVKTVDTATVKVDSAKHAK